MEAVLGIAGDIVRRGIRYAIPIKDPGWGIESEVIRIYDEKPLLHPYWFIHRGTGRNALADYLGILDIRRTEENRGPPHTRISSVLRPSGQFLSCKAAPYPALIASLH